MGTYDHHQTRKLIRKAFGQLTERISYLEVAMSENADRINTALDGLAGDVAGLKAAYDALVAAQASETAEAVEAAKAEFEASLDALAAKAEALDAETPPVETPEEPVV